MVTVIIVQHPENKVLKWLSFIPFRKEGFLKTQCTIYILDIFEDFRNSCTIQAVLQFVSYMQQIFHALVLLLRSNHYPSAR